MTLSDKILAIVGINFLKHLFLLKSYLNHQINRKFFISWNGCHILKTLYFSQYGKLTIPKKIKDFTKQNVMECYYII